jgi:carboxymethylenebutenolidase
MPGEMVALVQNGERVDGYLATPASGSGHPGVVVIQEWWGLVPHIKDVADRFAREGFVALAPDLYHGRATSEPSEAEKLMMDMKREVAARDLERAVEYTASHPMCSGMVGVVGFCLGGGLALMAACGNASVAACVDFYGVLPGGQPDCDRLAAPVLGLFGGRDPWVPAGAIEELERSLRGMGKTVETVVYPNCDHAFFNDTGGAYDATAAADAWGRTLEWFSRHLR